MSRYMWIGILLILLAIAGYLATASPPALLSKYDAVIGGGREVALVGENVGFGDKGLTLDIWRSNAASNASKKPVLIFWHGGGWVKGSRRDYAFAARAFAQQGFVVVVPDYRKVPDVHFPDFIDDGAQAVRWVQDNIAQYGGDRSRLAFSGHSAGAHTAVLLALDPRWLIAAGVDMAPIKAVVGLSGPYDFYPFDKKRSINAMSRYPQPERTQPVNFASTDAPPMLLITSSGDSTVRPRNAISLTAKLEEVDATVEMINYDGLDHEEVVMALSKAFRSKGPILDDSVTFLNKHM
ncbi:alpha/beta hydrolase [Sphingomonadales bacterium EhC05]|nr:alpha/beta hydrolase [Sphingomonadales bacterium EhC05]